MREQTSRNLKRTLTAVVATLVAMAAVSCARDMVIADVPGTVTGMPQRIEFAAYASAPATKGVAYAADSIFGYWDTLQHKYVNGAGIGVFAFYQKAKSNGNRNDFNGNYVEPDYFYNQKVERFSANGTIYDFIYSPYKYWPNNTNDQLSFFAYAPYDSTLAWEDLKLNSNLKGTKVSRHYTLPTSSEDQTDLLWANPVLNRQTPGASGQTVNFDFRHICARLGVSCKINNDNDASFVTVDKVIVRARFNVEGDMVYYAATDSSAWEYLERSYHTLDYTLFRSNDPAQHRVRTTVTQVGGNDAFLFPFPGTQDVTVTVTLYQNNSGKRTSDIISHTFSNMELAQGKAYNILLDIKIVPIEIGTVTVTDIDTNWSVHTINYQVPQVP